MRLMFKKSLLILFPALFLLCGCTRDGTRVANTYMSRQYCYIGSTIYNSGFEEKEIFDASSFIYTTKDKTYFNFKYDHSFEWKISYKDDSLTFHKQGTYTERDNIIYLYNEDGSEYTSILATLPSSIYGYAGINSIRIPHELIVNKITGDSILLNIWSVGEFVTPHIWD